MTCHGPSEPMMVPTSVVVVYGSLFFHTKEPTDIKGWVYTHTHIYGLPCFQKIKEPYPPTTALGFLFPGKPTSSLRIFKNPESTTQRMMVLI